MGGKSKPGDSFGKTQNFGPGQNSVAVRTRSNAPTSLKDQAKMNAMSAVITLEQPKL